jgi:carboxymethylenebutenolidase
MSAFLRFALILGLVFTLAGCSSAPGGAAPQPAEEASSTTATGTPGDNSTVVMQMESGEHMAESQTQGFLVLPPGGKGPGVLVLHAWWGLNDTIKDVCTQLARAGFVAYAPDLYHGKVADNIADAETLSQALGANNLRAKADLAEATRFLSERSAGADRGLAVIGFSLGAYYALDLAAANPDIHSVVLFYGTGGTDHGTSRAAYLGHFAESDEFEPQSNVDDLEASLKRAGRPVMFHLYSGTGHWFFEPDRPQAYNQEAARLAWDRTLAFLRRSPNS